MTCFSWPVLTRQPSLFASCLAWVVCVCSGLYIDIWVLLGLFLYVLLHLNLRNYNIIIYWIIFLSVLVRIYNRIFSEKPATLATTCCADAQPGRQAWFHDLFSFIGRTQIIIKNAQNKLHSHIIWCANLQKDFGLPFLVCCPFAPMGVFHLLKPLVCDSFTPLKHSSLYDASCYAAGVTSAMRVTSLDFCKFLRWTQLCRSRLCVLFFISRNPFHWEFFSCVVFVLLMRLRSANVLEFGPDWFMLRCMLRK